MGRCNCPPGPPGPRGPQGPPGPPAEGPQLLQQLAGAIGAAGPAGLAGALGPAGLAGLAGALGAAGPAGLAGLAGALGAAGLAGATGPTGPTGATGAAGANGATGFGLSQYGYVYNLLAQVVPVNADVLFDTNGILTPGITHAPGTSQIVVTVPGDYEVTFNVTAVEPNQFTLLLNGNAIAGATYGTGAGTQKNVGQVIVAIPSGGILTLRNHTSASAVTLQTLAGGTEINVNASILLKKLN